MDNEISNTIKTKYHFVTLKIPEAKYVELKGILEKSSFKSLRALIMHILNGKKVTLEYHDATMDHILWDLASLRKDIQLMAISMNQAVIRLSQEQFSELVLAEAKVIEQEYQALNARIQPIFNIVTKLANVWLPK